MNQIFVEISNLHLIDENLMNEILEKVVFYMPIKLDNNLSPSMPLFSGWN
jgi:hypothetical protein